VADRLDRGQRRGHEGVDEVGDLGRGVRADDDVHPQRRRSALLGGAFTHGREELDRVPASVSLGAEFDTSANRAALSAMFIPTCNCVAASNEWSRNGMSSALPTSK